MNCLLKLAALVLFLVFQCGLNARGQDLLPSAKLLKEQVEQRNTKAILEAADTGDLTLIPYLKQLSSNLEGRSNFNHPSFYAHVALAKLGDSEATQQILAEVDNESPKVQSDGMYKLSLVGGKVAFKKFYDLLDDTKPRENTDCIKAFAEHNKKHPEDQLSPYCDVGYWSRSITTMFLLRKMVKNPPFNYIGGGQKEIDLWKEWIRKNKYLAN